MNRADSIEKYEYQSSYGKYLSEMKHCGVRPLPFYEFVDLSLKYKELSTKDRIKEISSITKDLRESNVPYIIIKCKSTDGDSFPSIQVVPYSVHVDGSVLQYIKSKIEKEKEIKSVDGDTYDSCGIQLLSAVPVLRSFN